MCEHLLALDQELKSKGYKETFRGQAWSDNCREWVYYNTVLDLDEIQSRYSFPSFVTVHVNNDPKSGTEAGFECGMCKDAVMGLLPAD